MHLLHLGARSARAGARAAWSPPGYARGARGPRLRGVFRASPSAANARAFLREPLLGLGQAALAPSEILLAALELVLARPPLALAGREVALRLRELLLARGDCGASLGELRGAPARESLGLSQLGVARLELLL